MGERYPGAESDPRRHPSCKQWNGVSGSDPAGSDKKQPVVFADGLGADQIGRGGEPEERLEAAWVPERTIDASQDVGIGRGMVSGEVFTVRGAQGGDAVAGSDSLVPQCQGELPCFVLLVDVPEEPEQIPAIHIGGQLVLAVAGFEDRDALDDRIERVSGGASEQVPIGIIESESSVRVRDGGAHDRILSGAACSACQLLAMHAFRPRPRGLLNILG
jgi:hypothetical protein